MDKKKENEARRQQRIMSIIAQAFDEDREVLHKPLLQILFDGYMDGFLDMGTQTYTDERMEGGVLIHHMGIQQKIFLLLEGLNDEDEYVRNKDEIDKQWLDYFAARKGNFKVITGEKE